MCVYGVAIRPKLFFIHARVRERDVVGAGRAARARKPFLFDVQDRSAAVGNLGCCRGGTLRRDVSRESRNAARRSTRAKN